MRRAYLVDARATVEANVKYNSNIVDCADRVWTTSFVAFLLVLQVIS